MKKIILLLAFVGLVMAAQAQSKSVETLFQKHKNSQEFFHLDIGGSFLGFAEGMKIKLDDGHKEALANSMERIKFFKLPTSAVTAKADFLALQKGLERERFDLMMEVSEKQSNFTVYTKGGARIKDIVVLLNDKEGDFLVFELKGDFDSKTVSEAGKSIKK